MTDTITLKQAVGIVLEGFTLPDAARKILETAYFAEAALAQQAEQGWVRVPVQPTQEMIRAGRTTPMPSDSEFDEDGDYRAVFIAMVAAAPKGGV